MSGNPQHESLMKSPDFEPPAASVSRIIKNSLPDNVMLTKDARAAFCRASGIFIFYLTHCANDFKADAKRSTINANDVMAALTELDFGDLQEPLEEFMEIYRKEQKEEATRKKAAKTAGPTTTVVGADGEGEDEGDEEDGGEELGGEGDADAMDEEA